MISPYFDAMINVMDFKYFSEITDSGISSYDNKGSFILYTIHGYLWWRSVDPSTLSFFFPEITQKYNIAQNSHLTQ